MCSIFATVMGWRGRLERKKLIVMRAGELKSLRVAVLGMSLAVGATAAGPARAFDPEPA